MSRTVMIMAGGTGGHVFPALAIAGQLRASRDIVWLGTERGIEARLVPAAGYPVEWIEVEGLRGKGFTRWLAAPVRLWFFWPEWGIPRISSIRWHLNSSAGITFMELPDADLGRLVGPRAGTPQIGWRTMSWE